MASLKQKLMTCTGTKTAEGLKKALLDMLARLDDDSSGAPSSQASQPASGRTTRQRRAGTNNKSDSAAQPTAMDFLFDEAVAPLSAASDNTAKKRLKKDAQPETIADDASSADEINDDDEGFSPAISRAGKRKLKSAGSSSQEGGPAATAAAPARRSLKPKPLVMEGLADDEKANPLSVKKVLKDLSADVGKTTTTKAGTILIFPMTEEGRQRLLKLKMRTGLSLRETKPRAAGAKVDLSVVIMGIHPSVADKEIADELARPCKRIVSAKLAGAPTWKVKMECESREEKTAAIAHGVTIGHQRYRVATYTARQTALQCFQCQSFGHIASACKAAQKCQKCGEQHAKKDCTADEPRCANCQGNHSASDFNCPAFVKETTKKEIASLSYASAVKKSGDQVDCVRLACSMATAITTIVIKRLRLNVSASDVCNDVAHNVALFYKSHITGEHVYNLAYASRKPAAKESVTPAPQHGN
jgi:hypothetical protein